MTRRKLLRCTNCNKPLAEIRDGEILVLQRNGGKIGYTEINIQHNAGGRTQITCSDCDEKHFFATQEKTLGLSYAIAKS